MMAKATGLMRKWWFWTALGLAVVVAIAAALASSGVPSGKRTEAPQQTVDMANIANDGVVAQGEGCVYYCNNGIWKKPDDGAAELWLDAFATSLALHDGYLYYTDGTAGNALYRQALDGGESQQVVPFSTESFSFDGGQLYFMCSRRLEHRGVYRCDPDGGNLKQLTRDNCGFLLAYDGALYYTDKNDGTKLMRMSADGSGAKVIVPQYVCSAFIHTADRALYYSTLESVSVCGLDGQGARVLAKTPAYRVSITGTKLLLSVYSYSGSGDYPTGIFTLDADDEAPVRINADQTSILGVGSGQLYYKSVNNGLTLMRSGMDGSDPTYVASGAADSVFDQIDEAGQKQAD